MTSHELANFFKESNNELQQIIEDSDDLNKAAFDFWKNNVIMQLNGSYKIKMKRLEIFTTFIDEPLYVETHKLNIVKTILRDMYFKYNIKKKKTKENLETEKLLKAREENLDFELELAKMITGDNSNFPYRSSSKLTEFFQNIGHNFIHNGETRKDWVKNRLDELNIKDIHTLLSQGLFKKKYFIEHSKKLNDKLPEDIYKHPNADQFIINADDCIQKAKKEFESFIKDSIEMNDIFDLSSVLDMNVNIELLFDNKAKTDDIALNELIEEARERFLNKNEKQIALEKLWGAFERLKTYFSELEKNGKDKKQSASRVIDVIAENFDKEFLADEFERLTKIGNNYRIRHHERNKLDLTDSHRNYFFFRMLSLIDLCLIYLNDENL